MKQFDFDQIIERRGSHAIKQDCLMEEFGREDLLPLWIADMDFAVCPEITRVLTERIASHPIYGYAEQHASYWQSIIDWQARRNNFHFTADEVRYIPGIVTGFGFALNHFTKPGDKVVIQEPVYHPFRRLTEGNGRTIVNNALIETDDGMYRMDFDGLEKIFATEAPVMMVLCNPHNPVGISWSAETLREVARLSKKYNVVVFSDEIHSDLMLYGHKHTTFATVSDDAAEVAVTFGAPSKTFNIAGFKSSWCVIQNPKLRDPFFNWLDVNEFNSSNFVSIIAAEVAYNQGEEWLAQCIKYLEGNIDFMAQYCDRNIPGIRVIKPQASFLVWLDCSKLGLQHEELANMMVNEARLALNDGAMFGTAGLQHFRVNAGEPRAVIAEAMKRLEQAVLKLKQH
ncbi:MAG: pyridoxal phosphate-dependent aminotransferase [Bacteroidales bacterium]|nr:pyridoxal phosphate-dependent aminotransferase [Candidatus Sodaliphilus aphodohippi]